jgi:hypothetical protein
MNDRALSAQKLAAIMELRDAALALLEREGERQNDKVWFNRHTPENPEPRLAAVFGPISGWPCLNVWAALRGKHTKVFNIAWMGSAIEVTSFRRGEWENELLAMGRAISIPIH